jgi:hypothetical protein
MMHTESCRLFGVGEDNLRIISQVCKEEDISIISTHDAIFFELKIRVTHSPQVENPVIKSVPLEKKLCVGMKQTLIFIKQILKVS